MKKPIPKFRDIPKFKSKVALDSWLRKNTYKVVHFVDKQQDLLTMHIHHTGEILQVDAHGKIYIGMFVNMAKLNSSAPIEMYDEEKQGFIPYKNLVIERFTKI